MIITPQPAAKAVQQEETAPSIRWLGQAGFLIEWTGRHGKSEHAAAPKRNRLVIDPYLSDFLSKKYKGKKFEHRRMMPPPVSPDELRGINYYFCTHRHSDHMDPETILPAVRNNPEARFIVPASQEERARELEVPAGRLVTIDGSETMRLGEPQITVEAIPSAHEELEKDGQGRHLFLGYIIRFPGFTVYHSGDCIPYPGLVERLSRPQHAGDTVDLALLPVNGRDSYRRENGIPGNFTVHEALELCSRAGIPCLIPHHFGMFAFNTVSAEKIRTEVAKFNNEQEGGPAAPEVILPDIESRYTIRVE